MRKVIPPMHHVKRSRTACRRTFEGCRWSQMLPDTIRMRLRGVSSYPCRKMEVQTWDSVTERLISSHFVIGSHLEEGAGLVPLPLLVEVLHRLVDHDLAVLGLRDAQP